MTQQITITLRLPPEKHMEIKLAATKEGLTIKDYVLRQVEKDLATKK